MNTYYPDRWVILHMGGDDPHCRVLGAWGGGYTQGTSWRMNSGITAVDIYTEHFEFWGHTGSRYICSKGAYGLTATSAGIYDQLKELHGNMVQLMPEDTDWTMLELL